MEIAALGLSGSGAATGNSIAGANDPAFAAALDALGDGMPKPFDGRIARMNSLRSEASSLAVPSRPKGDPTAGAEMRLQLLTSGAAVQTPPDLTGGENPLPLLGVNGGPVSAPLALDEVQASPLAPAAPEAEPSLLTDASQGLETVAQEGVLEAAIPEEPLAGGEDTPIGDLTQLSSSSPPASSSSSRPVANSSSIAVAAIDNAEPGTSPPLPESLAAAVEPEAVTALSITDVTRSGAAVAHPAQVQALPAEHDRSQAAASRAQHGQATAIESGQQPESIIDGDGELAEQFARGLSNSPDDRAPLSTSNGGAAAHSSQPASSLAGVSQQAALSTSAPPGTPPSLPAASVAPAAVPAPPAAMPDAVSAAAERHPAMSFRADKVAREMGVEIARRISKGGQELVIRLDPAELGRISIRMSVNEQGQLRAIVAADAPSVVDAIRNDISELSRAIEQAGIRTDSQSFRFDRGGSGEPGGQWQQRYQQPNSPTRHEEQAGSPADDTGSYRPLATNGRINMMA